jgi:hypothetical protein
MPITTGYVASSYLLPDPYFNGGDAVNTISYGGKTYRKHTFSTVGSATLSMVYAGIVNYAIVGGGGSGGGLYGGGGGAGALYTGSIGITSSQSIVVGSGGANVDQEGGYDGSSLTVADPGSLSTGQITVTTQTGLAPTIGGSVSLDGAAPANNALRHYTTERTIVSYNSVSGQLVISSGGVLGSYESGLIWTLDIKKQLRGRNGGVSSIGSLVSAAGGGGGGATKDVVISTPRTGGSGGGAGSDYTIAGSVSSGAASTGGGNAGGNSYGGGAGGGGGYGSVGANATSNENGANGGSGTALDILGTTYRLAAGGGGSTVFKEDASVGSGGLASGVKVGGDAGSVIYLSVSPYIIFPYAQPGVANTGSGGGGWGFGQSNGAPPGLLSSGAGGSGLVIVWYEVNV